MNGNKKWDQEPTPLCDEEVWLDDDKSEVIDPEFSRALERRLRHAWKLVNSLRIDIMHAHGSEPDWQPDSELLEQQLADIERALQ